MQSSGRCTLAGLLKNTSEVSYNDNKCPQCYSERECTQRSQIRKLLPVLTQHLKWFDNSATKMRNDVLFSMINSCLLSYITSSANSTAVYNVCGVMNQNGTEDAGHFISLCRSLGGDTWYQYDDQNAIKRKMSGISNVKYFIIL